MREGGGFDAWRARRYQCEGWHGVDAEPVAKIQGEVWATRMLMKERRRRSRTVEEGLLDRIQPRPRRSQYRHFHGLEEDVWSPKKGKPHAARPLALHPR